MKQRQEKSKGKWNIEIKLKIFRNAIDVNKVRSIQYGKIKEAQKQ